MTDLDDLQRTSRSLAVTLARLGEPPRIIGGVAVATIVSRITNATSGFDALSELDPRRLAALPRITNDVDFVFWNVSESDLDEAFREHAFLPIGRVDPPPRRYRGPSGVVDVIVVRDGPRGSTAPNIPDLISALIAIDATGAGFDASLDPSTNSRLATPWALVVLKCVAHENRAKEKDVVDLARLALVDLDVGSIREAIARFARSLPPSLQEPIRRMRGRFAARDKDGPSKFIGSVRTNWPRLASDDDLEDEVREVLVASVDRLLGGLDDD